MRIARNFPAIFAAFMLLLANSSHIHLRYCLDGDEAPISVSVHFETHDSHPSDSVTVENLVEVDQVDIESELSLDTLLGKMSKTLADSVAVSTFDIPSISEGFQSPYVPISHEILPDRPTSLFPPPRAPPATA